MKTNKEIAIEWGISDHPFNAQSRRGYLQCGIKEENTWRITDDAIMTAHGSLHVRADSVKR